MCFLYSTLALLLGYLMDILIGDPPGMPHIIRGIGSVIAFLERRLRKGKNDRRAGLYFAALTIIICVTPVVLILAACYHISPWLGVVFESLIIFQLLSTKSLRVESGRVQKELEKNDIEAARLAVSMIVGRDTSALNEEGVIKAAVETVAENTSDGCVAPLFYMMLGGAALGMLCKSVNTMDSMVGYKNEKYIDFGRAAALLDDAVNFIPARLSALIMIFAAKLCRFDAKGARRIWKRDRRNHASPNSAQTESVLAGALGIELAGPAYYFGVLHDKPTIGDALRAVRPDDIAASHRLLYATSVLMVLLAIFVRALYMVGGVALGVI